MTDKRIITEQIVRLQNELAKMQNLLEGEPDETLCPDVPFDCLTVTKVEVFPLKDNILTSFRGFANVVLNDQLFLRGLRINDSSNGLWVRFPVDPFYKGEDFRSLVVPMTKQLREHIVNCVLEKYQAAVE